MSSTLIDVFISHSNKEKAIAGIFKEKLQSRFNVFLAHEDIDGGEEWMQKIYEKIQECDVFVILLSEEYHLANYPDQETGIAYAMNKPMIPISLDGKIPYGFMSRYQATKGSYKITDEKIEEISNLIFAHTEQGQKIINDLIENFANSFTFADANAIAKILFSYTKFSKDQINRLAKAVIQNDQIRGGWTAFPLISDLLRQNMKKIDDVTREKVKHYL